MTMATLYKLTNQKGETHGGTLWAPGVTHTAKGEGGLCSSGRPGRLPKLPPKVVKEAQERLACALQGLPYQEKPREDAPLGSLWPTHCLKTGD